MKNTYKDAGYTYTINRLQETARTFRNLGDAYGETNQKQTGFKRQLILAADILEECVAMNLDAKAPDKQERREFERKCMAMGISVKDVKMVDGKRREILVTCLLYTSPSPRD